ncbi:vitelline membrane outer layer protein 1 homolog [Penaeus monodon]|uniref:vitelline membrane outer layer protein 1 homolog n=1 Tax=Penaeus monodon TaxID=6687 RepID=UPI0018A72AAE|nr:vitelline membrane outer layer protein 1 homolog [Penaeus monodon]
MRTLLALAALAALASSAAVTSNESLQLDNGLVRGTWGDPEMCAAGSHAFSFEIKYADLGHIDDTAVNGVRLYCETPGGSLTGYVTSSEGKWGEWRGMRTCALGHHLVGIQGNVVDPQGNFGDDLGVDNLRMECDDGAILDGLYGEPSARSTVVSREVRQVGGREVEAVHLKVNRGDTRDHGDWGLWARCSAGGTLCGLQTRVEHDDVLNDDAGLCDVIVFCCAI